MNDEKISFLQLSMKSIRKSIKGIDDSYHNFWDILAELLQNSVDAINRKEDKTGNIEIEIDSIKKMIRVKDDGIGIKKDDIPILLSPFSTDKEDEFESIGEKGVGLKFVIFQSNEFKMKTSFLNSQETSYVSISGARDWKNRNSLDEVYLHREIKKDDFFGTEILIEDIEKPDLFNLSFETMKFILRTKTVIGNVLSVLDNKENIKVKLIMKDNNNNLYCENIPYKYWLPIENKPINELITMDEYKDWLSISKRTETDKKNKLRNKIIYGQGTIKHNDNREIKYWTCVVPSRDEWKYISINDRLTSEEILDDKALIEEYIDRMHQPGIYMSVKGMPTGISIEKPTTGAFGYWPNVFIIFEDKSLKFDIGRKVINGNTSKIYKEYAKKIFNEFYNYVFKYIKGDTEEEYFTWDRTETIAEVDNMPRLNSDVVNFRNLPSDQEASVAAIFYELIGSRHFKGLEPVISGYKNKYDLYAYWNDRFTVIEFKSKLSNIINDFKNLTKLSSEVDYVVCWDVNSDDVNAFNDISVKLEDISASMFNRRRNAILPETTHKLIVSESIKPIYVLDLKKILEKISEGVEVGIRQ